MPDSPRPIRRATANDLKRPIRPISTSKVTPAVLDRDLFTLDPVPINPDTSGSSSNHVTDHIHRTTV